MKTQLRLPGWDNQLVIMIEHGEHHMSAETTEILLPFKIEATDRLFMTNGRMFLSLDGTSLFIHDATILLKINGKNRSVQHFVPPAGCFISEVREYENGMGFRFYGTDCSVPPRVVPHEHVKFTDGAGPMNEGLMPSAFKPHVDAILRRRKAT